MIQVYQLETTNYCNAKCNYCPHGEMTRSKGFAPFEVVEAVYDHLKKSGQTYIGLHHMGEPLLHPQIDSIICLFENGGIKTEFSTNGLLLPKVGEKLLTTGLTRLRIAVDHFYHKKGYIDGILEFLRILAISKDKGNNTEVRIHTIVGNDLTMFSEFDVLLENKKFDNWAGAIEGESELSKSKKCYFKEYQHVVVLWDGRIVPCCMDYDAKHVIGDISNINKLDLEKKYKLCKFCANLQFANGGEWNENLERC